MEEQLLALLEERLSTLEEITAHLFNGYVELATMVESVITQIVKPLEPEAAKAFSDEMTQHRRDMLGMVNDVARSMAGSPSPDDSAVEDVAGA